MPHLVLLYTPELEQETDMSALCRALADTMLAQRLAQPVLLVVFAGFMLFTAWRMWRSADPDPDEPSDWIEYLLFSPVKGFTWLVETDEGWERVQVCDTWPSHNNATSVRCDALILDEGSRSETYPYIDIQEDDTSMSHEATVGRVSDDQIFYLMSRGMTENEATNLIVQGFLEVFTKELPMEYALEFNRLIRLEMEGALG